MLYQPRQFEVTTEVMRAMEDRHISYRRKGVPDSGERLSRSGQFTPDTRAIRVSMNADTFSCFTPQLDLNVLL